MFSLLFVLVLLILLLLRAFALDHSLRGSWPLGEDTDENTSCIAGR